MYRVLYALHNKGNYTSKWIAYVQKWMRDIGTYLNLWENQCENFNLIWFKGAINVRLRDIFTTSLVSEINQHDYCINYRLFKNSVEFEEYLDKLPYFKALSLCKFRLGSSTIPVARLRFSDLDRVELKCDFCDSEIGDEFHLLLCCKNLSHIRVKYIKKYYFTRPNTIKFNQLMNCTGVELTNLTICVKGYAL